MARQNCKNWNEIAENSARFETYKIGIQQGKSRRESALSAKNITVNFNKKGEWGQYIDQLFLFANAGMQGTKIITHAQNRMENGIEHGSSWSPG